MLQHGNITSTTGFIMMEEYGCSLYQLHKESPKLFTREFILNMGISCVHYNFNYFYRLPYSGSCTILDGHMETSSLATYSHLSNHLVWTRVCNFTWLILGFLNLLSIRTVAMSPNATRP